VAVVQVLTILLARAAQAVAVLAIQTQLEVQQLVMVQAVVEVLLTLVVLDNKVEMDTLE
jgi:hypothetical protein